MAKVVIERSANKVPTLARSEVAPGEVFILVKKDGSKGKKLYGALGNNGKFYSVNLETGALASAKNLSKMVAVVGYFSIERTDANPADHVDTTRGEVKSGQLFRSTTGVETYLAMGKLSDGRRMSINMADPYNEDYAVSSKPANPVTIVGDARFVAKVSA